MKRSQWNDQWWSLVKAEKVHDAHKRRAKKAKVRKCKRK